MRRSTALLLPFALALVGCSQASSRVVAMPAVSTVAGATSQAAPAAAGALAQKASTFEDTMRRWHLPYGLVQDVRLGSAGQVERMGGQPSRALWTGFFAATEAMRYRVTGDAAALAGLEQALWALHDLHEITGVPGVICRGYDLPHIEVNGFPGTGRFAAYNWNKGTPSRDQYSGWFYGIAQGFPHVQDPALRRALQDDVRAVADRLMAGDLEMKGPWGPSGNVEVFFHLDPAYFYQNQITAQTWATVDDFPFDVIAKSVPYSPQLANAITAARIPPVRAGEALKAVFMFTVAAEVTGDPRYSAYKDQLLHQRGFADAMDKYMTFIDDVLHGTNRQVAEDTLRELFRAAGDILQAYLVAKGSSSLITQVLVPLVAGPVSNWLASSALDLVAWIQDPSNAGKLQQVMQGARLAAGVLRLAGQPKLATTIEDAISKYGVHLSRQGLIDFADTVRSHLGVELNLMPIGKLIELETDPQTVALYRRLVDRYHSYLGRDHNPMVNLLHHQYGTGLQVAVDDVPHALDALARYPTDMSMREVDNSGRPGLVVSPWADRHGKVGRMALTPHHFGPDERAPHIFLWNEHPRQIKTGTNRPDIQIAPLGYLTPYWLARELGVLRPVD